MTDWLIAHEDVIRLSVFFGLFAIFALTEHVRPLRILVLPRQFRWLTNLGLIAAGTALLRLALPVLAVGAAWFAENAGIGLFAWVAVPYWAEVLLTLVLLDLFIYAQHVVFHHVPFLWRLHKNHHTDLDLDVTTALRFHPLEILISMGLKIIVVLVLGAPVAGVILFEMILSGMALFNHSNWRLPPGLETVLRRAVVTPAMHIIHHSCHKTETNSNYGFNLSCWDRLFGTYTHRPQEGYEGITLGLEDHRKIGDLGFWALLMMPFVPQDKPYKGGSL